VVYVRCSKTGREVLDGVASSAITRLAVPCLVRRAIVRDPDVTVWHPAQEYCVFGRSHAYLVSPSTCQDRMLVDTLIFERDQQFIDYRIGEV
jgi:hypothetical protein